MTAVDSSITLGRVSLAMFSTIALLQCLPLLALEPPSKPFLDKNSFYLSSAGFKVHFSKDATGNKADYFETRYRFIEGPSQ
jgi:hypothetical protein